MATRVLDLEIRSLPTQISDLGAYQKALILLRLGSLPVACIQVPVFDGHIDCQELAQAAANCLDEYFWKQWAVEYLDVENIRAANFPHLPATIAVCTRDRPQDLARCLDGIHRLPDDGQEIVVVDSASASTETRQVVDSFTGVRYLRVDLPGLNRARNCAMQTSRREIVAFIDDDAVPDAGWLRGLQKNFADPLVMAVTGLTMPLELETQAQEIFETYYSFSRGFRRNVFDRKNKHPLAVGSVGAGANMALRRVVHQMGLPFDEALDAGTPTQSGGETEMFSRLLTAGYRIVYDPAALNWHRHRRSFAELQRVVYGYGVGVYAFWTRRLFYDKELVVPLAALRWFASSQIPDLARGVFQRTTAPPMSLQLAMLAGCLRGPIAYLQSRRQLTNAIASPG